MLCSHLCVERNVLGHGLRDYFSFFVVDTGLKPLLVRVDYHKFLFHPLLDLLWTLTGDITRSVIAKNKVNCESLELLSVVVACNADLLLQAPELPPVVCDVTDSVIFWSKKLSASPFIFLNNILFKFTIICDS